MAPQVVKVHHCYVKTASSTELQLWFCQHRRPTAVGKEPYHQIILLHLQLLFFLLVGKGIVNNVLQSWNGCSTPKMYLLKSGKL